MVDFHQLTSAADLDAAFALRHRVCVEELRWVPPGPAERETDGWDDGALHVGAFAGRTLIGYVRVVPDSVERGTMTHRCFAELIDTPDPRPPVTATGDLSRLVLDPAHRTSEHAERLVVGLVDQAQHRSQDIGLGYWYLVTGDARLDLLRRYYATVRTLGRGTTSDGGTNSVVLVELASRRPAESRTAC